MSYFEDVFNQSPFKTLTGKDSPIEPSKATQKKIGMAASLPLFGGVVSTGTGVATGGLSLFTKMFGSTPATTKTATQGFPWLVAGGGAVLGAGTALFFGKKGEQTQAVSQQQQPIQITKTYSPVTTTTTTSTYSPSFMNISDSPYASMKKADTITSDPAIGVSPQWSIAPGQTASQAAEQGQTQGTDLMLVAAIAAVGLIAYGYVSKPKGRRK